MIDLPLQPRLAIQDLMGEQREIVHKRDSDDVELIRSRRLAQLEVLEGYFIGNVQSEAMARAMWASKRHYCLFLRSYAAGQQELRGSASHDGTGVWRFLDGSSPPGGRLLKVLQDILPAPVLLVAVANPDEALLTINAERPFANLIVETKCWRKVVRRLIQGARAIIVHKEGASRGLKQELGLVNREKKMAQTIVVREPEAGNASKSLTFLSQLEREDQRAQVRDAARLGKDVFRKDSALKGFKVIDWRTDADVADALQRGMSEIFRAPMRCHFESLPPFRVDRETRLEKERYRRDAKRGYELFSNFVDANDFKFAEEILFDAIACGFLAHDAGARASCYLELGKHFLVRLSRPDAALPPLRHAVTHFGVASARAQTLHALFLCAAAFALMSNAAAASGVVQQAEELRPSPEERAWEHHLWERILTRETSPEGRSFGEARMKRSV